MDTDAIKEQVAQLSLVVDEIMPAVALAQAKSMRVLHDAYIEAGFEPWEAYGLVSALVRSGKELVTL